MRRPRRKQALVGEVDEEFQMALDREDELEVLMEDSLDVLLGEKSDRSPGFGDRNQPHVRRTKTHPPRRR